MPNWKYIRYDIEERWERLAEKLLAPRDWLNRQNPKIIIAIAGIFVFVLLAIAISLSGNDKEFKANRNNKAWFYDLNTGELFTAKTDKLPPIKAPSGHLPNGEPAGVRAYVFSYAKEPNESDYFIGFLETFTPEAKKHLSKLIKLKTAKSRESIKKLDDGRLVRRAGSNQWVPANSNEGRAIINEALYPNENRQHPHYCPPK